MAFDRRETSILLIGDFLILVASFWVALTLRNFAIPAYGYFESNFVPFLPMFLISLSVFYISGLYEKQTRPIRRVMGARILGAQATTVAIAAILFFVLPLSIEPKTILMLYLAVSVVAESVWRFYRMKHELKEEHRVPALLVGSGAAVLELYEEVSENSRYLVRFAERFDTANATPGSVVEATARAIAGGVRVVVVDVSDARIATELPSIYGSITNGVTFVEFASLYEEIFDRVPLEHLDATQLLDAVLKQRALYDSIKRIFDVTLAVVGALIAAPFICLAALTLLMSGGQPFIWSERIGKGGRIFRLVKLRSMLHNDKGDPELQKRNRVTAIGRFLRKTRIDELPQLWNVLVGDLSFIGPRPELPKIVAVYEQEIPYYQMRHAIAPGLSGWAQIHDYDAPRGPADVVRTRRKLSLDLYYLKHRSFGLDIAIALKTLRALLAFSGT